MFLFSSIMQYVKGQEENSTTAYGHNVTTQSLRR
jgi:hypothetical protein